MQNNQLLAKTPMELKENSISNQKLADKLEIIKHVHALYVVESPHMQVYPDTKHDL